MTLKVDFCSYDAALYACKHWHYSKVLPASKLVKIGAWEDDRFIGCIIFSRGASPNISKPYAVGQENAKADYSTVETVSERWQSATSERPEKSLKSLTPA